MYRFRVREGRWEHVKLLASDGAHALDDSGVASCLTLKTLSDILDNRTCTPSPVNDDDECACWDCPSRQSLLGNADICEAVVLDEPFSRALIGRLWGETIGNIDCNEKVGPTGYHQKVRNWAGTADDVCGTLDFRALTWWGVEGVSWSNVEDGLWGGLGPGAALWCWLGVLVGGGAV